MQNVRLPPGEHKKLDHTNRECICPEKIYTTTIGDLSEAYSVSWPPQPSPRQKISGLSPGQQLLGAAKPGGVPAELLRNTLLGSPSTDGVS